MKLYESHSPIRKSDSGRYFKSIKNSKSIGGDIVLNIFGNSKEHVESRVREIMEALSKIEISK